MTQTYFSPFYPDPNINSGTKGSTVPIVTTTEIGTITTNTNTATTNATNALAAASQAQSDAAAALNGATGALASAAAAAASAASASNNAAAAAASSSSASNSATTATNASNNATTANTNAQAALTSANSARDTAIAQATAAAGSATTAAGSATTATNQANAAAGSATSASGSANTATTQASNALASSSSAATSATNAGTSASAANTSAVSASTSSALSSLAQAATFPAKFHQNNYSDFGQSNNLFSAVNMDAGGTLGRITVGTSYGYGVWERGIRPLTPGRKYRLHIKCSQMVANGGGTPAIIGFVRGVLANGGGDNTGDALFGSYIAVSTTSETEYSAVFTAPSNPNALLVGYRIGFLVNRTTVGGLLTTGSQVDFTELYSRDITEQDAAAASALAAAASASSAAISASDAGVSASSAQTSATNAATSAGGASTSAANANTSASQASTSATNAAGSASTASTQATNAANSATAAGGSASAAAGSASTAITQASNASNSASSALASSVSASSSSAASALAQAATFPTKFHKNNFSALGTTNEPPLPADMMTPDSSMGRVTAGTSSYGYGVWERGIRPLTPGRKYQVYIKAQQIIANGGTGAIIGYSRGVYADGTGDNTGDVLFGSYTAVSTTALTGYTFTFIAPASPPALIVGYRIGILLNRGIIGGSLTSGSQIEFSEFYSRDITEQDAALTSANAAATSATSASTSATNAATSATSATTQANTATTQAGNATASASAASGSAATALTNANNSATSAASAATQATLSASYANEAAAKSTPALNYNPQFEQGKTFWYTNHATETGTPVGTVGTYQGKTSVLNGNLYINAYSNIFPVKAGKYELSASIYAANISQIFYLGIVPLDANKASLIGGNGDYFVLSAANLSVGWNNVSAIRDILTTFPTAKYAQISMLLDSTSNLGGTGIDFVEIKEVTGREIATTQANIATTQATNASASASSASTSANLSATYRDASQGFRNEAEGFKNTASSQATIATTQATNASSSAAFSQASAVLSASIGQGTLNKNPVFADWIGGSGTYPDAWANWINGTINIRVSGDLGGYAFQQAATGGTNYGISNVPHGMAGVKGAGYYVLEADVTLISGSLESSSVYIQCTGFDDWIQFSTAKDSSDTVVGAGTVGRRYKFRKLVQSTVSATDWLLLALTSWNGYGTQPAKTLKWHSCSVRDATPQEIRDKTVLLPMEATVATNSATLVSHTSSIASLSSTVSTQGSSISTQATAITNLNLRTASYLNRVSAGAGVAEVEIIALDSGSIATSAINLRAQKISLGSLIDPALEIVGGVSTFKGELNVGGTTGARANILKNVIKIYDATGQIRVKLGDLSL